MGGNPYWYFVPYEPDLQHALDSLREREFKAGRYNTVMPFPNFDDPAFFEKAPGAKHPTIEAAMEAADADGTRSILDIALVRPTPDFGTASPIDPEVLEELYGTTQPTRLMLSESLDFFDDIDRGQCVYCIIFENGAPSEIMFAGYSYD